MSSIPLELENPDCATRGQAPVHALVSLESAQVGPRQEGHTISGDFDDEDPMIIEPEPDTIYHDARFEQPALSPNEDWMDEKVKAQEIRVTVLKTEAISSKERLPTSTTKQHTWSSVKTILEAPKKTFSSLTKEKLRLRTSSAAQSAGIAQWGIDWYQPFCMLGLFLIGIVGMICHHVYNSWFSGRVVDGNPQWIQRFGSGFSFFNQMCMVGAANIAYKQLVWLTIKKRDYSIETLDGIFSICTDPLSYLNFELLSKATIPAILAGIVWGLPLCAVVTPSTLTSVGGTRDRLSNCSAIPSVNFQNENGINQNSVFVSGEGMSFFDPDPNDNFTFYYDEPSMDLRKIESLALLSGKPLTLPNPCEGGANCTWSSSFDGPAYDCQERDDFDPSTGLSKDMLAPAGTNIYTSTSTGSEDEYGRPTFWQTENWQNWSTIGTFEMEPSMWIGFVYNTTEFISWDNKWPYRMDPHVVECTLYNTTYNYNMSFTDGVMSFNLTNKTLITPALPSGSSIVPMDPNYEAFAAYHGAGFLFRTSLSNNITQNSGYDYAQTNSAISQTSLIDPDTAFAVPHFPTKVEQQFSNIILSLAAFPSFYSQVNVSGPCTVAAAVLEWNYQPFWLVLSYFLAGGVTLVAVGIGCYAFRANGYSADTTFSTFLTTTRNPTLDRLSEGYCLGQTPLPKDFRKQKLRFGVLGGSGGYWDREHVAFGLADETRNVEFGKTYA